MNGIYLITNIKNNKQYVGKSKDIEKRWKRHINELNKGVHHNLDLQKEWLEYGGVDNFTFKILELCTESELFNRENHWITTLNTTEFGYNFNHKKGSKRKWNMTTKRNKEISILIDLCNFYVKENKIGMFSLSDVHNIINIKDHELRKILENINKNDLQEWGVYMCYNFSGGEEYISFCNTDLNNNDVDVEYFTMEDINKYIKHKVA